LVRAGEIDLAFCSSPPADDSTVGFKELFRYNTVLLTPQGHQLSCGSAVTFEDIASWSLILPDPAALLRQRVDQGFKDWELATVEILPVHMVSCHLYSEGAGIEVPSATA
jgi:DNA-binding transcriptional LysR family regulator